MKVIPSGGFAHWRSSSRWHIAVGTYVYLLAAMSFWAGIDVAFILRFGWAGLSFAPAGDSHIGVAVGTYIGVAVGTYVYLLAAMSFGQALTLPSFSALVGQDCHLLRRGIRTLA